MNTLVRIITNDDGEPTGNPFDWHLTDPCNRQGAATLCTGEFYGIGESACTYEVKEVLRGGITCKLCNEFIRTYKSVKL